jgi:DNA-binding LytR/AlgR family response regulator
VQALSYLGQLVQSGEFIMPLNMIGVKMDGRKGDLSDFVEFSISEVNYIKVFRPKNKSHHIPIYHTSHGSYAPLLTLRDLTKALSANGFRQLDNSTLVNNHRIKHMIKSEQGLEVIFNDNTKVNVALRSRKR